MLRVQLDPEAATGDPWIDTGLAVLLERYGPGEHDFERLRRDLIDALVQPTGGEGEYWDPQTRQIRTYGKRNWIWPVSAFIRVAGKSEKKVEVEGRRLPTSPPVFDLDPKFSKRPRPCDICGDEGPSMDAKMWAYPFVVEPGKFGNFYSGTRQGIGMCPRCVAAGLAAYLGMLWRYAGGPLHLFLFHTALPELCRVHREALAVFRLEGERGGNIPVAFGGPYPAETVLGLLLELFGRLRREEEARVAAERGAGEVLAELLGLRAAPSPAPLTLVAVSGQIQQAFRAGSVRRHDRLERTYRLYERLLNALAAMARPPDRPHVALVRVLGQFWQRRKERTDTIWREQVAAALLAEEDPLPHVEAFLFDVQAGKGGPLAYGTTHVFDAYAGEVLGMEERLRRIVAGFGHTLGRAVDAKKEQGLLYALRNARNLDDFLRVLNDVQFRLGVTVPGTLVEVGAGERISGVPWQRVKTLLAIHAMNAFLGGLRASGAEGEEPAEEGAAT